MPGDIQSVVPGKPQNHTEVRIPVIYTPYVLALLEHALLMALI